MKKNGPPIRNNRFGNIAYDLNRKHRNLEASLSIWQDSSGASEKQQTFMDVPLYREHVRRRTKKAWLYMPIPPMSFIMEPTNVFRIIGHGKPFVSLEAAASTLDGTYVLVESKIEVLFSSNLLHVLNRRANTQFSEEKQEVFLVALFRDMLRRQSGQWH